MRWGWGRQKSEAPASCHLPVPSTRHPILGRLPGLPVHQNCSHVGSSSERPYCKGAFKPHYLKEWKTLLHCCMTFLKGNVLSIPDNSLEQNTIGLSKMDGVLSWDVLQSSITEMLDCSLRNCISDTFFNHSLPARQYLLKFHILYHFYFPNTHIDSLRTILI